MSPKEELKVPEDLQQCQQLIVSMHQQMRNMQSQLDVLLRAQFGQKSESLPVGQLRIFEEQAENAEPALDIADEVAGTEKKQSHGRKSLSRDLPRVRKIYDIPESEICCPECNREREIIGEEKSEQYDYTPASIQIIEHVRLKRACKSCAEHVVTAAKPAMVIEKGLATAEMLGYVATSKYADHQPLNRLEGIFKRDGAPISRSTMCDWMIAISLRLEPLYLLMKDRVKRSKIIWTDDTPVKMQDREDERNMRNARVWVYIGDETNDFTVFDFTESRKRDGPVNFLGNFSGYIQADAFSGYDCIYASGSVTEVACWAHTRRKFFEALQTNGAACNEALAMIQELYALEKKIQEQSKEERSTARAEFSQPILLKFKSWLDKQRLFALPKSPLGKAVTYALNNWEALCRYTTNADLSIDNNKSERALRAMAVGRKNWLFMGSAQGGKTAAIIASFMATCKAHDLHPRKYLADVLTRIANGESDLESLLPGHWQEAIC